MKKFECCRFGGLSVKLCLKKSAEALASGRVNPMAPKIQFNKDSIQFKKERRTPLLISPLGSAREVSEILIYSPERENHDLFRNFTKKEER